MSTCKWLENGKCHRPAKEEVDCSYDINNYYDLEKCDYFESWQVFNKDDVMTPEEFEHQILRNIELHKDDHELMHLLIDRAMGITLIKLGYERGIKIYDSVRDYAFTGKETSKVRCKDCKYFDVDKGYCTRWKFDTREHSYCGKGEAQDGD